MAYSDPTIAYFMSQVEESDWLEALKYNISDEDIEKILSKEFWFEDDGFICSSDKADEIKRMIFFGRSTDVAKELGADQEYESFDLDISDLFDILDGDTSKVEELVDDYCEDYIHKVIEDWIDNNEPDEDEDEEE